MRYALKLDTAKPEDVRTLTIRKGEFGSITLVFEVSEEGKRLDLAAKDSEGESAYTVRFCARTGNGVVVDDVSVAEDGSASYTLPAAIGASAGMVRLAYLRIESAGAVATTQCVWFKVLDAVDMDAPREVYIPEFERLKGELDDYVQRYADQYAEFDEQERKRQEAESAREKQLADSKAEASAAADAANAAANGADSARDDALAAAIQALAAVGMGFTYDPVGETEYLSLLEGEDRPNGVPSDGVAGQVLTKTAGGAEWKDAAKGATSWGELTGKPSTFTPSAHEHPASDITSGTLDAERLPTIPASKLPAITSGLLPTVPVSKGGTGAADAATARSNLGITIENLGVTLAALGVTMGTGDPPATGTPGSIYIKLGGG